MYGNLIRIGGAIAACVVGAFLCIELGKSKERTKCEKEKVEMVQATTAHNQTIQQAVAVMPMSDIRRVLCEKYAAGGAKWDCDKSGTAGCKCNIR